MTHRIEPVGPRRDLAPVERVIFTPVERQAERERRERRRREQAQAPAQGRPEPPEDAGGLDVRA